MSEFDDSFVDLSAADVLLGDIINTDVEDPQLGAILPSELMTAAGVELGGDQ